MHDVFISYSHKDKTVADAISARLEREGIRCWYAPRDISPGADWAASIIEAISQAKVMVLIFTDYSNASAQVLREVNNAISSGVTVIPFKLTESEPTKGMQYYLSTVHWLDAMTVPLEKSIERLYHQVDSVLNGKEYEREETQVHEKKKKWLIPVIIGAAVLIAAAGAGIFFFLNNSNDANKYVDSVVLETEQGNSIEIIAKSDVTLDNINDISNTGTQGNIQSNYQNDAIACSDLNYFYFQGNDHQSLYRMNLDGSGKSKLNSIPSKYIGVSDDYVYYYSNSSDKGIYRMRPDGTDNTCLFTGSLEDMMLKDDRIYFRYGVDGLKLYSIANDGSDLKKENDIDDLFNVALWDKYIFWSNQSDGGKLYRADIDGSNQQKLTDSGVKFVTPVDGWIVYAQGSDICMMNVDSLETQKLFTRQADKLVVCDSGIYLLSSDDILYRAALGTHEAVQVTQTKIKTFSVCGGYVFYSDMDTGKTYILKYDGTWEEML